jgi:hypothetical protein
MRRKQQAAARALELCKLVTLAAVARLSHVVLLFGFFLRLVGSSSTASCSEQFEFCCGFMLELDGTPSEGGGCRAEQRQTTKRA